jgi:hypothetical protein
VDAPAEPDVTSVAALLPPAPATWRVYSFDLGLGGIWAGLTLLVVVRLVAHLMRIRGTKWAVPGAIR